MRKIFGIFLILVIIAAGLAAGIIGYFLLEVTPPRIEVLTDTGVIGREYVLTVRASDQRSGLRGIEVELTQNDKKVRLKPLDFQPTTWWKGTGITEYTASWKIHPLDLGLGEGRAVLKVMARDSSLRNGFKGNQSTFQVVIPIDVTPPQISVISSVHNIRQGGSGVVSYKVSEPSSKTGVWVDDNFFPGYPRKNRPKGSFVAFIAVPYDLSTPKKMVIEAVDEAGNRSLSGFPYRILKRRPKKDNIRISDSFLQLKMPDFMSRYPELKGSLIDVFLKVNNELRTINNKEIKAHCKKSRPEILWHGPFVQLPRSQFRAGFADERHYLYKGKEIDQAHHMGVDLASVKHAKIPAANSGIVVFAGYLGIYGNTVIIDHGMGLFSTYSHMSELAVKVGDKVKKGEIIGKTGMTGLAGGDHLHFGMLINDVFVNPMEWWDGKWIKDHIIANLSES